MRNGNYISIYLRNAEYNPSCYYRVYQYVSDLEKMGCCCKIHEAITTNQYFNNLKKKNRIEDFSFKGFMYICLYFRRLFSLLYDLGHAPKMIVVQRELFPRYMPFFIGKLYSFVIKKNRVVWDFDDNIIWEGEIAKNEKKILENYSDRIIVTHDYLKDTLPDIYRNKVILLPTTDKKISDSLYNECVKKRISKYDECIRVIWVGTGNNLKNLDLIVEQLDYASEKLKSEYNKDLEFVVVSNLKYVNRASNLSIKNVMWERDVARQLCMSSHIGIMPLYDGEFARGKGGFKLVQYLACGMPVIASDVGFNNQIVDETCGYIFSNDNLDMWQEAILTLALDKKKWLSKAESALIKYENSFSYDRNMNVWKSILRISK